MARCVPRTIPSRSARGIGSAFGRGQLRPVPAGGRRRYGKLARPNVLSAGIADPLDTLFHLDMKSYAQPCPPAASRARNFITGTSPGGRSGGSICPEIVCLLSRDRSTSPGAPAVGGLARNLALVSTPGLQPAGGRGALRSCGFSEVRDGGRRRPRLPGQGTRQICFRGCGYPDVGYNDIERPGKWVLFPCKCSARFTGCGGCFFSGAAGGGRS